MRAHTHAHTNLQQFSYEVQDLKIVEKFSHHLGGIKEFSEVLNHHVSFTYHLQGKILTTMPSLFKKKRSKTKDVM